MIIFILYKTNHPFFSRLMIKSQVNQKFIWDFLLYYCNYLIISNLKKYLSSSNIRRIFVS